MASPAQAATATMPVRRKQKYVQRACLRCKQRKSKCDGESECGRCSRLGLKCEYPPPVARKPHNLDKSSLVRTVQDLEALVQKLRTNPGVEGIPRDVDEGGNDHVQGGQEDSCEPLADEFFSNLKSQVEAGNPTPAVSHKSTPVIATAQVQHLPVQSLLSALPSRPVADLLIGSFLQETAVIHPMLHVRSFLSFCGSLWDQDGQINWAVNASPRAIALVFTCLALGGLERAQGTQDHHTSNLSEPNIPGWEFYLAARDIIQQDMWYGDSDLVLLQCLTYMAWYLLKVRPNDAYKMCGLAVRSAHELRVHRKDHYESLRPFDGEMHRRAWWCLFNVDRQMSLALGRPGGIRLEDVDVEFPVPIDDKFLQDSDTIAIPSPSPGNSLIPFLNAMSKFGIIAEELTGFLYGPHSQRTSRQETLSRLDAMVVEWQSHIEPSLRLEHSSVHDPRWLLKQTLLMYTRPMGMRIIIHRSAMLSSQHVKDNIEMFHSALRLAKESVTFAMGLSKTGIQFRPWWYDVNSIVIGAASLFLACLIYSPEHMVNYEDDLGSCIRLLSESSETPETSSQTRFERQVRNIKYLVRAAKKNATRAPVDINIPTSSISNVGETEVDGSIHFESEYTPTSTGSSSTFEPSADLCMDDLDINTAFEDWCNNIRPWN